MGHVLTAFEGVLAGLVPAVLGSALAAVALTVWRRRTRRRADAAGAPMVFEGSILGAPRYCHPAGGLLRVTGASLEWLTGNGGIAYPVPTDRLVVDRLSRVPPGWGFPSGSWVRVHCLDGAVPVTIVCPRLDLQYLARALPQAALLARVGW